MSAALATEDDLVTVGSPGVYDLPAFVYHSDPVPDGSLSSSGARRLLPPSCPALYRHWATVGQQHKEAYDFGHAAHALVLGVGAPIVAIDADNWRTKQANEQRDDAYAAGSTPLLRDDYQKVQLMAAALRKHPIAAALFNADHGRPEQSLFWVDGESRVWRRAMVDWLPAENEGRLVIPDYKSCRSADPGHLAKALHEYGYHQQAAWYLDGVKSLELSPNGRPAFVFVFQEKTPPYLVTVAEPDSNALEWGRLLNRKAIDLYRQCTEAGQWPGYADETTGCADEVISLGIPSWADRQYQAAWERGAYETTRDLA
jgi:PDDEXK-like uncharacterized protein DUF3799